MTDQASKSVSPVASQTKLPLRLKPLTVPFAGAFACQDAMIAERTLEGGSPYEMSLDDADVYRCFECFCSCGGRANILIARLLRGMAVFSNQQLGRGGALWPRKICRTCGTTVARTRTP